MRISYLKKAVVPGVAALALAASLTACGAANEKSSSDSTDSSAASAPAIPTNLTGTLQIGGSTAQQAAQAAWAAALQGASSGLTINYNGNGSGGGVTDFESGKDAFAGTDGAIVDNPTATPPVTDVTKSTARCGSAPIEVPVYASAVDIVFNVSGVSKLTLDAATAAGIFSGKITTWNDPAIAALNSGVTLPSTPITPIHRSDASGTQQNFTDWLNKAAPSAWTNASNKAWPTSITAGQGQQGNPGVATALANDGTIGFVDNSQAVQSGLKIASIQAGGTAIQPTEALVAAAVASAAPAPFGPTDLAVKLDRTTTTAYPITLISYVVACASYSDGTTGPIVKALLDYALSDDGQKAAAAAAGSAPLGSATTKAALALVDTIK